MSEIAIIAVTAIGRRWSSKKCHIRGAHKNTDSPQRLPQRQDKWRLLTQQIRRHLSQMINLPSIHPTPSGLKIVLFMLQQHFLIYTYLSEKIMSGQKTKYVNYKDGAPECMFLDERELVPQEGEVLLKVKALGINRAETLHRQGKYKINRPAQSFLGLEASGQVFDPKTKEKLYDGMALLTGGSYAQWALVPRTHVMPLPSKLNFVEGAAIPEAWITAFQLLRLADVKEGQHVVIYAGASGVGTAAIQLCRLLGAVPWAVVSTPDKGALCQEVKAEGVVYYKDNANWAKDLLAKKGGPFNVVLDCVGAGNAESTVELLGVDGKWVLFGLLSGGKVDFNLGALLGKRINLISTTLKTRSDDYKSNLIADFSKTALEGFDKGALRPIIYKTYQCDWSNIEAFVQSHKLMESNANAGKLIIEFK